MSQNPLSGGAEQALTVFLEVTAKSTLLLVIAWMATAALRRRSAALRHQVWAVAICASLLLPLLATFLPRWRAIAIAVPAAEQAIKPVADLFLRSRRWTSLVVSAASGTEPLVQNKAAVWILSVWAVGFALVVLRLLAGLAQLDWLSSHCALLLGSDWLRAVQQSSASLKIHRPVRLLQCHNPLAMPLTWGLIRPQIVLPAIAIEWPNARRHVVVTHELAHISRQDWIWQICSGLLWALYWHNPLAWLAARKLRHESERACDDLVLASGVEPSDYADHLLELAQTLQSPRHRISAALAIARKSNLERRFTAMLDSSIDRSPLSRQSFLLTTTLVLCLLVPLAVLHLSAQTPSGRFAGTIHDPSTAVVPTATITMSNSDLSTIDITTSDATGNFAFKALPAGKYAMKVLKPGFAPYEKQQILIEPGRTLSQDVTLNIGSITDELDVLPDAAPKTSRTAKSAAAETEVAAGGNVQAPRLVKMVRPVYPATARQTGAQGSVILHAVVGMSGVPLSLRVMNSQIDPELARAATEAVSQWRYRPTLLNGQPIEVDTTITVNFKL